MKPYGAAAAILRAWHRVSFLARSLKTFVPPAYKLGQEWDLASVLAKILNTPTC